MSVETIAQNLGLGALLADLSGRFDSGGMRSSATGSGACFTTTGVRVGARASLPGRSRGELLERRRVARVPLSGKGRLLALAARRGRARTFIEASRDAAALYRPLTACLR